MNNNVIKDKIDEIIDDVVKVNRGKGRYGEFDYFASALFLSENIDEINDIVKSCLAERGVNVVEVTADGYEISRRMNDVRFNNCLSTGVICPDSAMTDKLTNKNTVLFLPNLEKMSDLVYRRLLLDMARTHIIADPRNEDGGFALLDSSFFAVATVGKMDALALRTLRTYDAKDSFNSIWLDKNGD